MSHKKLPRVLTKEEAERLLDQANERFFSPLRNKALLALTFRTGLRSAEVRHLKDDHVDLNSGRLIVRYEGAKNDRERQLWFPDDVADLLRRWMEFRDENLDVSTDLLFSTRNGTMLAGRYLRSMIKRYAKKAGLAEADRVNFHCARHTALTWKLEETGNLRLVQKMAGHADVSTTTLYTHLTDAELEHAMKNGDVEPEEEEEPSLEELIGQADENQLKEALMAVTR